MPKEKDGQKHGWMAHLHKIRRRRATWYVLAGLAPLVVLLCVQLMTQRTPAGMLEWFVSAPLAALYTYLFLLLAQTVLSALTGSLFWSVLVVEVPFVVLGTANYLKEVINGAPILVSDLAMAGQMGNIAQFVRPDVELTSGVWLALLLVILLPVAVGYFARCPKKKLWDWPRRLGVGVCALVALVVLLLPGVFHGLLGDGPNHEDQAQRNQRLGLLAGFYDGVLDSVVRPDDAYSEETMNTILQQLQRLEQPWKAPKQRPNVVMVMSESFCDPTAILPNVYIQDDPIPFFRSLAQKWPAGAFLSNSYAGGTGNVEMEVLTGVPNGLLGEGETLTSLQAKGAYDRIPSIVRTLREQGYATEFIHTYTDELYGRADHIPRIGFDKVRYASDFPADAPVHGPYLSDEALAQEMIAQFEARDPDKPMFLFGLSMENHQPYYGGKFPNADRLRAESSLLNDQQMGSLEALLQGLHGADQGLKTLVEYFEDCGEPVLLVFWGDHLPSLYIDASTSLYSLTGYTDTTDSKTWTPETLKKMFTTPFLVWNNYGARLDVPNTVGAPGLGAQVLEWAGAARPLYYQFADAAREKMLIYNPRLFVDSSGQPYEAPTPEAEPVIKLYHNLVYDTLYGEGYISKELLALPPLPDGWESGDGAN